MGAYVYDYESKLLYENKESEYEEVEQDLPDISYALQGEVDIRGDSLRHTLLFKARQGQKIIELHHSIGEEDLIYFVVFDLEKRTKNIYRAPNEVDIPFEAWDCRRLGLEPTAEELDREKEELDSISISDEDLPF
jgi:hypothetical protein